MLKTVDDDEKMTITNGNSGGKTEFLTENGLYGLPPTKREKTTLRVFFEKKLILTTLSFNQLPFLEVSTYLMYLKIYY